MGHRRGWWLGALLSITPDGIDDDCGGVDGVDDDGDGHASWHSGGDDCDDANVAVGACR